MEMDHARDLLANLLERARASNDKVFLTRRETTALAIVLEEEIPGAAAPANEPAVAAVDTELRVVPVAPAIVLRSCSVAPEEIEPDAVLCVDFGTSFSKAFVSIGDGDTAPQLIDLPIGDTGSRLTTPSELFIDGDQIYFGSNARRRWDDVQAPAERLIDSIKQFITLNQNVSALRERAMPDQQDPRRQFSQRDILVLYLAHLTALTEAAVEEKGLTRNVRRRFTHPAWKDGEKIQNEKEMRQLMAEAIMLARSAPAEFAVGISLTSARQLLDELAALGPEDLPSTLISDPVREATAAGAGALMATREGRREAYLVLDIGAGTTDVAGFYCLNNPNNERLAVIEVTSAADAKNVAGNALDNALQRFVLERSGLDSDSAEARLASHALRRQLRATKERLFRTGREIIELTTDQVVEVDLEEFLAYGPVVHLTKLITDMVASSAVALAGDSDRLKLVATGGGAGLPLVLALAKDGIHHGDKYIAFDLVDAMADDLRESHPDLIDHYPQIAVALGGSLPQLPEQRSNIERGITLAPRRTLAPMYRS